MFLIFLSFFKYTAKPKTFLLFLMGFDGTYKKKKNLIYDG